MNIQRVEIKSAVGQTHHHYDYGPNEPAALVWIEATLECPSCGGTCPYAGSASNYHICVTTKGLIDHDRAVNDRLTRPHYTGRSTLEQNLRVLVSWIGDPQRTCDYCGVVSGVPRFYREDLEERLVEFVNADLREVVRLLPEKLLPRGVRTA